MEIGEIGRVGQSKKKKREDWRIHIMPVLGKTFYFTLTLREIRDQGSGVTHQWEFLIVERKYEVKEKAHPSLSLPYIQSACLLCLKVNGFNQWKAEGLSSKRRIRLAIFSGTDPPLSLHEMEGHWSSHVMVAVTYKSDEFFAWMGVLRHTQPSIPRTYGFVSLAWTSI